MGQVLSGYSRPSIVRTVQTDSEPPDTGPKPCGQTGSDDFAAACHAILGKDAGLHLHHITGYPERSCYRYASGEREAKEGFIRALFHSDQGEPFFKAFMAGCEAQWWIELQRDLHNANEFKKLDLR